MSWETSGFRELLEDVAAMAARLDTEDGEGAAAKSILAHAAVPIHEQMQQNASTDPQRRTGRLYRSIQIGKVKKKRGGGQRITIGVHRQAEGAYYSTPVEFSQFDEAIRTITMKLDENERGNLTRLMKTKDMIASRE